MKVLRSLIIFLALVVGVSLMLWLGGYGSALEEASTPDAEAADDTAAAVPPVAEEPDSLLPLPPSIPDAPDTTELPAEIPEPTDVPAVDMPAVDAPVVDVPPRQLPSGLIIPVAGIEPDDLIDTFEEARSQRRTHDAIDIIAPHRTPVLAAADGTIVRLFESEHGGTTIYQLAPDDRTVYYYAHLDGYAEGVRDGVFVQQGAVIGYVGDTGNAVPGNYHLHFAIWRTDDPKNFWDGESINPYPLLGGE